MRKESPQDSCLVRSEKANTFTVCLCVRSCVACFFFFFFSFFLHFKSACRTVNSPRPTRLGKHFVHTYFNITKYVRSVAKRRAASRHRAQPARMLERRVPTMSACLFVRPSVCLRGSRRFCFARCRLRRSSAPLGNSSRNKTPLSEFIFTLSHMQR